MVSGLFILTFIINLLIRLHRQRDQHWFVVRKCRTHLETFEKQVEARPPTSADFARLNGSTWTLRDGAWVHLPRNMLAVGDVIGLLPDEVAPCLIRALANNATLEVRSQTRHTDTRRGVSPLRTYHSHSHL